MEIKHIITDFFVGGIPKAGTTSMWKYLSQHPNIYMGEEKEIYYFTNNWSKGKKWYLKKYKKYNGENMVGDGSINIILSEKASRRIKGEIEDPKVIFIFRDPVERLISAYRWRSMSGKSDVRKNSFGEFIRKEKRGDGNQLKFGMNYSNLVKHENILGKGNIKCILFSRFVSDTKEVMREVFRFLGVDPHIDLQYTRENASESVGSSALIRWAYQLRDVAEQFTGYQLRSGLTSFMKQKLQSTAPPVQPSPSDLRFLERHYADDIRKLQRHLGWDLSHWLERFRDLE
jgi:hypothetical protein